VRSLDDLPPLPAGSTAILCPLDDCDWMLVEPPRTSSMSTAEVAEVLSHADPTACTVDEVVTSAVANTLLAETKRREQVLTEHFESHGLLDFLRTIHALRAQLGEAVTEYGQVMADGGYHVRNPHIERMYPVADWIADERQHGRFVARRRVVVVEDWIEVTEP
jgi:hypothetical protein